MSEIKVNKISPRTNCGTVTLGDSGDTFTIPSGATINNQGTATNFGATGSASWTTTVKTGDFTAVAGEGYFVDTSSGEIDVALPAGTAGAVVAIADYAKNFSTNNCILVQNGSDKIGGSTTNAQLKTDGLAVTLIFIDSTKGWIITDDGLQSSADTNPFIEATGGTESTSGNCKIHTFTSPGTFTVSSLACSAANNAVAYMVVAGGGGTGVSFGGGGGAGGFREGRNDPVTPYTASPLVTTGLTVTATGFPITVGAGGAAAIPSCGGANPAQDGSPSSFSTITSTGGGGGGHYSNAVNTPTPNFQAQGRPGGSGGGGADGPKAGGNGNTPSTSPAQGSNGGTSSGPGPASSGGGATAVGGNQPGGAGGAGATTSINGTPTAFAGGGGGAGPAPGSGGAGGGGAGAASGVGTSGTANTGGGGGGSVGTGGTTGGSGIVIIRYKFQ